MTMYRIVETDNFGGDYPDEKFVNVPLLDKATADSVADLINTSANKHGMALRFYKVEPFGYKLQPGFEP